jgi:hypothetical protein
MRKIVSFVIFFIFVLQSQTSALEITYRVIWKDRDPYAKYFDSATPGQILNDVVSYFPDVHKDRVVQKLEVLDYFKNGNDRKIKLIFDESGNKFFSGDYQLPLYTLGAYIWVDNDNEGYIYLWIAW